MSLLQRQKDAGQVPYEIESLQALVASKKPKVIVEIGSAFGGTLARWLDIDGVDTVISVDLPGGRYGGITIEGKELLRQECEEYCISHGKTFIQILGDSHDPAMRSKLDDVLHEKEVDFLFIDGDHSYEGVLKDFEMYADVVKENGLVGFHDILNSKFHRKSDAFVQGLWYKLKRFFPYTHYITSNKEDYKMVMPASYPSGFGGIGVIRFTTAIFQQFLSQPGLYNMPHFLTLKLSDVFEMNSARKTSEL